MAGSKKQGARKASRWAGAARVLGRVVAQNIRQRREKLGLTQEEMARKTGFHSSYICHLEKGGHGAPSLEGLVRLSQPLKVHPFELLRPGPKKRVAAKAKPVAEA